MFLSNSLFLFCLRCYSHIPVTSSATVSPTPVSSLPHLYLSNAIPIPPFPPFPPSLRFSPKASLSGILCTLYIKPLSVFHTLSFSFPPPLPPSFQSSEEHCFSCHVLERLVLGVYCKALCKSPSLLTLSFCPNITLNLSPPPPLPKRER